MDLSEWVVNSLDQEDYAFDFEIRPTGVVADRYNVNPSPFFVQLKSSKRFDDEDEVWSNLDVDFLTGDCLSASIPVVLVVYERAADELYWCVLQSYCWDVLDEEREGWRDQTEARVRFPRTPIVNRGPSHGLSNAVEAVQRRITLRSHVATARRPSFEHPPGTNLASSSEVTAHKADLVEEARILVDADHPDVALEKAMRVYQMPEEDEPTLDAVELLLELRVLDSPDAAFAKQRLARQGSRLAEPFDRPDLRDEFAGVYDGAWAYVEEQFVGATYLNTDNQQPVLILDVQEWVDRGDDEPLWMAVTQFGPGELAEEDARDIASSEKYELIDSGADRDPLAEACEERTHDFPEEDLREYSPFAICRTCDLSRQILEQLLGHEVPSVCDDCGCVAYETEYVLDQADDYEEEVERCTDCAG